MVDMPVHKILYVCTMVLPTTEVGGNALRVRLTGEHMWCRGLSGVQVAGDAPGSMMSCTCESHLSARRQ